MLLSINSCDLASEDKNNDSACNVLDCQGPQGIQGESGPQGEQGPPGITPEEIIAMQNQIIALQETVDEVILVQNELISTMYTQAQLDEAIADATSNFDVNLDGQIGLSEAIQALQITTGLKPQP